MTNEIEMARQHDSERTYILSQMGKTLTQIDYHKAELEKCDREMDRLEKELRKLD